ncbi:type II secretion system F family protein [Paremcibacter congregatus]|uniref:Pilus assembly protein TadC n=1 Tax=Paremcibacter congregatus TaxID=2043170 RepID=A0A2G4YTU5_9PROT|nr:type II secretion system F family protein [Paremcibacter congregatus]PHZ84876.1 pilus assembly protein TadC [Paremcibacter congregatus]QDE26150.1 type II secretion system F family protein [Paremcibacter congregatus]
MEEYLPDGVSIEDIITVMAAISAFLVMLAIWSTGIVKDSMHGRIKHLQDRRSDLKRGYSAPTKRRATIKQAGHFSLMQSIVKSFNLLKNEQAEKFRVKLLQGGFRSKESLVYFLFFKLILPLLIGAVAMVMIYGFNMFDLKPMMKVLASGGAILVSSILPETILKNITIKRNTAMQRSLPDMLDLLVICAEAGLTLDSALQRVVKEMGQTGPELADELNYTAVELGFLPERRQALNNLADRVTLPSVRSVTATLIQSEKYGTPLAQSLRVLSAEFRNERMMKAEEKAAKLPATMTIPLILFILPTLFVVLIGPAACQLNGTIA